MHLLNPGCLLRLPDRVDYARMTTRRDDDESAVLHVIDGGVLALERVSDQITRLRFDLRRSEMACGACGVHRSNDEPSGGRRLLEVRDPGDLAGDESVPSDRDWLLREHNLEAARLEGSALKCAVVDGTCRSNNDAMTEGVLAARIEGEA